MGASNLKSILKSMIYDTQHANSSSPPHHNRHQWCQSGTKAEIRRNIELSSIRFSRRSVEVHIRIQGETQKKEKKTRNMRFMVSWHHGGTTISSMVVQRIIHENPEV